MNTKNHYLLNFNNFTYYIIFKLNYYEEYILLFNSNS